jgi:hypothetical protein
VRSDPAEPGLHFIGDTDSPGRAHPLESTAQVAVRWHQDSVAGEDRIEEEGGRLEAVRA